MSNIYTSADQLIGKTPLLELTHIEQRYGLKAKLLAKLEYFNPAGSVKDRIAKAMIDAAEASVESVIDEVEARAQAALFDHPDFAARAAQWMSRTLSRP